MIINVVLRFFSATALNSFINFCLFSAVVFVFGYNYILTSYFLSSMFVLFFAYLLMKNFVFKSKDHKFFEFFLLECGLILLTCCLYFAINLFWSNTNIVGVFLIYGLRLLLSFFIYKKLFIKSQYEGR